MADCVIDDEMIVFYGDIATADINIIRFRFCVAKEVISNYQVSIMHVQDCSTVIATSWYSIFNKVTVGDCHFTFININGSTILVT